MVLSAVQNAARARTATTTDERIVNPIKQNNKNSQSKKSTRKTKEKKRRRKKRKHFI